MNQAVLTPVTKENIQWQQPKEVIKAILETDSTDVFKSLSNKMMHNKREITPIIEDASFLFLFVCLFFFFFFNVNISAFHLITF